MRPARLYALLSLAFLNVPAAAQSDARPYRALGTEPFWSLTIGTRTMRLEEPARRPMTVPRPAARASFNGRRYTGRRMTVDVTRRACSDGMSDRTYPETVTVQIGRRALRGCGGGSVTARPAR